MGEVDQALRQSVDRNMGAYEQSAVPQQGFRKYSARVAVYVMVRKIGKQLEEKFVKPDALQLLPSSSGQTIELAAKALQDEAGRIGARLVFVYLPGFGHATQGLEQPAVTKSRILDFMRSEGLPIIDIEETFKATGDLNSRWAAGGRGHYSPEGYALVAAELVKFIQSGHLTDAAR